MRQLQQNQRVRCVLAAGLCLLLLAGAVPTQAAGRETIQALTRQQQDLRWERRGLEQALEELGQEEDQALSRKGLLEQKINVLSQEIQVSQQRIDQLGKLNWPRPRQRKRNMTRSSASGCGLWRSGAGFPIGRSCSRPRAFLICWTARMWWRRWQPMTVRSWTG